MQHIRNLIIYIFISFFTYGSIAQNVTIKGEAINAVGKKIRLIKYSDLITMEEEEIVTDIIEKDKSFILKCDVKETIQAFLLIDYYGAEIYLEPNSYYEIKIEELDFYEPIKRNNFFYNRTLIYDFKEKDSTELNRMLWKLEYLNENFIAKNIKEIALKKNSAIIDSFRILINNEFADVENEFFKTSLKYKIAQLDNIGRLWRKESFFKYYFYNTTISYENPEYMIFFNQFFDKYIISTSKKIYRNDLLITVNDQVNYAALMDTLGKDTLLRNQALRELVLIKNMKDLYYDSDFNKQSVLEILYQSIQKTKFKEHKIIANNLIKSLTRLNPGYSAPDFSLMNHKGKNISLKSFDKKYICLFFFSLECMPCMAEMPMIERIYDENDDIIEFVCISIDNQYDLNSFIKNSTYKWTFLQFADNFKIFQDYDIKAMPFFILIDTDRNIVKYDAIRPSQGFENWFVNLYRARK